MVALTGIEWVTTQFSSVQFSLSRFFSVQFILHDPQWSLSEKPWCERVVSATSISHASACREVR